MKWKAHFGKRLKPYSLFFYGSTFFNTIFILFALSLLNEDGLGVLINSDSLYLPSIYQDITEFGHSLNGWNLNPAPNFFPDMLLYGFIAMFGNNFIVSIVVFAINSVFAYYFFSKQYS